MAKHIPPTILIAEDDADETFLLNFAFGKSGVDAQLRFVPNGEEAIAYLEAKAPYENRERFPSPNLLILDLKMPLVTGFDVLKWLQSQPKLKTLPVIVHTGSDLPQDKELAAKLGASEYHVKGFSPTDNIQMFQELGQRWLKPGPAPQPAL
jgi:CheY-like chemotaxis protein